MQQEFNNLEIMIITFYSRHTWDVYSIVWWEKTLVDLGKLIYQYFIGSNLSHQLQWQSAGPPTAEGGDKKSKGLLQANKINKASMFYKHSWQQL